MTRDDYIKLHRQTVAAIDLVEKHGEENCVIECSNSTDGATWSVCIWSPDFSVRFYRARLKPQKQIVPWESLDQVPLTHWFRLKGGPLLFRVESIDADHEETPLLIGRDLMSMRKLFDQYEHAVPCDKYSDLIWLPCGKEVVE